MPDTGQPPADLSFNALERFRHRVRQRIPLDAVFSEHFFKIALDLLKACFKPDDAVLNGFGQRWHVGSQFLHCRKHELFKDRLAHNALKLPPRFLQVRQYICVLICFLRRLPGCTGCFHHVLCIQKACCLPLCFVQRSPRLCILDNALFNRECSHLRVIREQANCFAAFIAAVDEAVQVGHGFIKGHIPERSSIRCNQKAICRKRGRIFHVVAQTLELRRQGSHGAGHARGRYARLIRNRLQLRLCRVSIVTHDLRKGRFLCCNVCISLCTAFAEVHNCLDRECSSNNRADFLECLCKAAFCFLCMSNCLINAGHRVIAVDCDFAKQFKYIQSRFTCLSNEKRLVFHSLLSCISSFCVVPAICKPCVNCRGQFANHRPRVKQYSFRQIP